MRVFYRLNSRFDDAASSKYPIWAKPGKSGEAGRPEKKLKVIVVDDERVIAETLADILSGQGCEAVALSSGIAAIEVAREIMPDVVISDVAMPEMNGIETVQRIRAFLPECRVVLFSGHAATADLLKQARAEGDTFELLTKPVKPAALLSLLGLLDPEP
jgi:CheY-like chemotaxis protein